MLVLAARVAPVFAQPSRVASSPGLFEYHSAFWVNLHHLLYEQARSLEGLDGGRAIVQQARDDTTGIGRLAFDERASWDAAIRYYRAHIVSHDLLERQLAEIKAVLGDHGNERTLGRLSRSATKVVIEDSLRVVLEAAAPSYRTVWWQRHDQMNRRWIAAMRPRVEMHGPAMQRELSRIFHIPWSQFLIRVDVSAFSNWAGAYTTNYPDRITVASMDSDYTGPSGVEMLFHESLHTLDDSLTTAITAATQRAGKRAPPEPRPCDHFFLGR